MNIIYTDYGEDSVNDRKINKKDIENALLSPDEIVSGKKGRKISHKLIGNKLLRVVYESSEKAYIVITAYYTKPKRYFKNENKI